MEIRQICEVTGLSETAVVKIIENSPLFSYRKWINKFFETQAFSSWICLLEERDSEEAEWNNEYYDKLYQLFDTKTIEKARELEGMPKDERERFYSKEPIPDLDKAVDLIQKGDDLGYSHSLQQKITKYEVDGAIRDLVSALFSEY